MFIGLARVERVALRIDMAGATFDVDKDRIAGGVREQALADCLWPVDEPTERDG